MTRIKTSERVATKSSPPSEPATPRLLLTQYEKFGESRWGVFCQHGAASPVLVGEWWIKERAVQYRDSAVTSSRKCKACQRPYRDHIVPTEESEAGEERRERKIRDRAQ